MSGLSGSEGADTTRRWQRGGAISVRVLDPGVVLQQRYEIIKVLGLGGMSTVYLARDRRFTGVDKLCAVKEMADLVDDRAARQENLELFEREANMLAGLNHSAIPKIYDFFPEGNKVYLIIEYIDGKDLESLVESMSDFLAEADVVDWAVQICDVLIYLHNHKPDPIIFRDLKPSNVMCDGHGRLFIIDFGIAKVFQTDKKGTIVGTEGYAPPEQYKGTADPRTDVYALGATMHYLLTKSDPRFEVPFTFHERPPRKLNPKVSEAVEAIIMRALQYDMEKRYPSVEAMKEALLAMKARRPAIVASEPVSMAPPPVHVASSDGPKPLWEFACEDEIRSTPLVYTDTVYVGSYDRVFYALDAKTGVLKWSASTQGGICSSGCVWRESIVFGSEDNSVYAVHSLTGRLLWTYRTQGPVRSSPRAGADSVFVGSDDQYLYCIDGRSGRLVWRCSTWRPVRSSPVLGDGFVYVGSDDEYIYAIDTSTGMVRWKFHTMGPITSSPVLAGQCVIVASTDQSVYALDSFSGYPVWRFASEGKITSSPCIAGDSVFVGSVDRRLYCIDLKMGTPSWTLSTDGPITSSPKVYGGDVYVGSVDGHIYCAEAATGKLKWKYSTKRPIPGSPAFGDGVVYFGSLDGKLYALTV